jgi:hypothetical protein
MPPTIAKVRALIVGVVVLTMAAMAALSGPAALAAARCGEHPAAAASAAAPGTTAPCAGQDHGPATRCCHGSPCPTASPALATSAEQRSGPPATRADYAPPESARVSGITTRPGLHPPRLAG